MDTVVHSCDLAFAVGCKGSRRAAFTFDASEEITNGVGDVCRPIRDRICSCWTAVIAELNKLTTSEPTYQVARTLRWRALVASDDEAGRCESM